MGGFYFHDEINFWSLLILLRDVIVFKFKMLVGFLVRLLFYKNPMVVIVFYMLKEEEVVVVKEMDPF